VPCSRRIIGLIRSGNEYLCLDDLMLASVTLWGQGCEGSSERSTAGGLPVEAQSDQVPSTYVFNAGL
jgi:hypothetical protein